MSHIAYSRHISPAIRWAAVAAAIAALAIPAAAARADQPSQAPQFPTARQVAMHQGRLGDFLQAAKTPQSPTAREIAMHEGRLHENSITGGSSNSSQPATGSGYSSVNSITHPATEPSSPSGSGGSQAVDSGYPSLNAITGPPASEPTVISAPPSDTADGFDWVSATIGAGTAVALVALGGAATLTVRRRTAVSPSGTSMS